MTIECSTRITQHAKSHSWIKDCLLILGASILISLFGPLAIPLPFTPVPLVLQCHVVLVTGLLLGSKRGSLAVALFLVEGACGLPVFSGGVGGLLKLFGPTGGYLFGYVLAAYMTGFIAEMTRLRTLKNTLCSLAVGNLTIFACGLPWLSLYTGLSMKSAFVLGMLPFIVGDILKLTLCMYFLKAIQYGSVDESR